MRKIKAYPHETPNILVTDFNKIEWHASSFMQQCRCQNSHPRAKEIRWKNPPEWVNKSPTLPLLYCKCQVEGQWLDLYSFPSGIKRDFFLADLDLEFDGVLLIVDLGAKQFWENRITRLNEDHTAQDQSSKSKALRIPDPILTKYMTDKEIMRLRTSAFGDPRIIWGLELVDQIEGAKLVLAVKSSPDSIPASYIEEHLRLDPPIDILECEIDRAQWNGIRPTFSDEVIGHTLSLLSQIIDKI